MLPIISQWVPTTGVDSCGHVNGQTDPYSAILADISGNCCLLRHSCRDSKPLTVTQEYLPTMTSAVL
jgi:hypothetical protein